MSFAKDRWIRRQPSADDLQEVCLDDDVGAGATGSRVIRLPLGRRPDCFRSAAHEWLFVGLIAFAAASPVFLQRSVVVVAESISQSLSMTPAQVAWSTASSGLTTGAFLLPFGHVADTCRVLPRKTLLVTSLGAFAALVACTALARDGIVLDVISGLTGVACAANVPMAVGILSLAYPVSSRRKNMAFSSFLMGTPAATIIGGLGSGALAFEISWKAPFLCLSALYAAVSILTWVLVPNVPEKRPGPQNAELRIRPDSNGQPTAIFEEPKKAPTLLHFDWFGLFLLITGVLLFTVSLSIGPQGPEPWKTPTVILLLTLGILILGCFILWENVTKVPMIPPSLWDSWNVTLIVVCTLIASMTFYSQLFWVSMFMQELEHLDPFDVSIRLLPQALVGLLFSPLVGLVMHRVSGTILLAIAAGALVLSNVLLIFLRQESNYLVWIFPSIMLSTVGMDWTVNVGSLYILSTLPLKHHAIGASLLQTTSRLAVPLGMAVTTAVWSSYEGIGGTARPELAYTNTFIVTTAFSTVSLVLVPFIHINKQGDPYVEETDSEASSLVGPTRSLCQLSILAPSSPFLTPYRDIDKMREKGIGRDEEWEKEHENRPSKRWSPMGTVVASSTSGRTSTVAPSVSSESPRRSKDTHRTESTARATVQRGRGPSERVVWVVCEECGTSKRHPETTHPVVGDPAQYFNDPACGGQATATRDHQSHQLVRRNHSRPIHPAGQGTTVRQQAPPKPVGRRRMPLANREMLTHQMLTQGFLA
ncbi:major facilitator superfamily domain-containing protein [Xylariaceae sp. FL0804]|nr:major facilitator superfamily domain-containing protein [Xylariaceae sp. FL0804]